MEPEIHVRPARHDGRAAQQEAAGRHAQKLLRRADAQAACVEVGDRHLLLSGGIVGGRVLHGAHGVPVRRQTLQDITEAGTLIAAAAFVPCAPLLIQRFGRQKAVPLHAARVQAAVPDEFGQLGAERVWRVRHARHPEPVARGRNETKTGRRQISGKKRAVSGRCRGGADGVPQSRAGGCWPRSACGRCSRREMRPPAASLAGPLRERKLPLLRVPWIWSWMPHWMAGVPFALLLAGYTGVLLSTSATPLWARKNWLGALFSASAVSTGASAIELALQMKSPECRSAAVPRALKDHRNGGEGGGSRHAGGVSDGSGQDWPRPSQKANTRRICGAARWARGLSGRPCSARFRSKTRKRAALCASPGAVAGLAGGLALRWAISQGGHISGKDPQAARDASRAKS